ncbi:hypothetical protein KI387_019952, partial [Taxus chinensis]
MGKARVHGDTVDYFKTLFGNITKGGLSLFSNKNPFYRKREESLEQGSGLGVGGAFEQGVKKNNAEHCESFEQEKKKSKNNEHVESLGQNRRKNEVVGEDVESLDSKTIKKKNYCENDEDLGISKNKKKAASGNGLASTAKDESSGKKKKDKFNDCQNGSNPGLEKVISEVAGENFLNLDIIKEKKNSHSEDGEDSDIRKMKNKFGSRKEEAGGGCDDSIGKKKNKVKGDKNSDNLGQEKKKATVAGENAENLDLGTKKKKAFSGNEESRTSNLDHVDKRNKKKTKEKLNKEDPDEEGNVGTSQLSIESQAEHEKRKKKNNSKKLNEEGSDGEGIVGSLDDQRAKLSFKVQSEDGKHGLLERKRKENMLEDLARSRKEKRRKVALEENLQSVPEVQADELQDMPRAKHPKRALEQDDNEPSKRIKVHHQRFNDVEGGARMGLAEVTELKGKGVTELKGKSVLRKRKLDAFEERYEVKNGLEDVENTSKEVAIREQITGKRKRDEDALGMASNKQDHDDREKLERTIFVGNLPLGVKRKNLTREFSQFGEVESLRLRSVPIVDTKLTRKGAILKGKVNDSINSVHAYVVFKDAQSANAAMSHNMTEFNGNHIRVDRAHPPRKKLKGENHFIYDTKRTIFVGNLPFDVKDEELYQLFAGITSMGSGVEAVRVIRDPQTSMGKGFAYVLFKSMDAAKLAVKKKDLKLKDRSLRLSKAQPGSNIRPQIASTSRSRSDTTPRTQTLNRKRLGQSREMSIAPLEKKAKNSLSYQGTKASKTDRRPIKLTGSMGMHNPQSSELKPRMFKRPAVAARRDRSSQSPGQNHAGKKRRADRRTDNSKPPKRIRVR